MICIDLNTGELFDGSAPFVHWFEGEHSTGLIYSHKICVWSDKDELNIRMDSDVFQLMDMSGADVKSLYKDLITQELTLKPCAEFNGKNIYIIYLSAHGEMAGEYRTDLYIDDELLEVGIDLYDEDEELYINLSNFGIELPDAIQKAFYSSNPLEHKKDNILLNRKLKELLSNYWDVIANKGSYKSLINSLKWFEWGDLIEIQEIWKHEDFANTIYDVRSLCSVLEDKYKDTLNKLSKTPHLALYLATQQMTGQLDDELNPQLEELSFQWSKEELMLKLALLGNFYETYFMPIHLNLLHATVENVVFTNTIKIINTPISYRNDFVYNIHEIHCSVKDNQSFILGNVKCQVNKDTWFGNDWAGETYENMRIVGVDRVVDVVGEEDVKTFYSQLYGGVGVMVPFHISLDMEDTDEVFESVLVMNDVKVVEYRKFKGELDFNLLLTKEGLYNITLQFRTRSGLIFNKVLKVNCVDVSGMKLNIYKVYHLNSVDMDTLAHGGTISSYKQNHPNTLFTRNHTKHVYSQFLPTTTSTNGRTGICLNNILVLSGDYTNDKELDGYYYMSTRKDDKDNIKYTVCVSKSFDFKPASIHNFDIYKPFIVRNDYGYFPEFHYIMEIDGEEEKDFYIYDDAVIVKSELPWGLEIDGYDWEFYNASTGESFEGRNLQSPMVSAGVSLSKGYYDIIFRYKIGEEIQELRLDSAFIKK